MEKLGNIILYGLLGALVIGAGIIFLAFVSLAITKPEVIEQWDRKRNQELVGLLIADGCVEPVVTKAFLSCPRNETSYQFKCTKKEKVLTGVLCENGSSAYIRYDLNNFTQ